MKIITCAGYYRTGSSAVTDFFGEFDNCKSLGLTEFRFLQDPDGIAALETNIIEHPHRHNTSHAIKRFLKYSKFENGNIFSKRYRRFFGDNYMKLTQQYIDDITQVKCKTRWRYDDIERGQVFYMLDALIETLYGKIHKNRRWSLLRNEYGYYTAITKEKFYEATKKYTRLLFSCADTGCEYLMIDQLAAPSEASKYLNYVDDLYIIVVERDPRDLYILENSKYRWGVIPQDDAEAFCKWYRITRKHRKDEKKSDRVKFIYLEDLIYHYEETTRELTDFIGTDRSHHTHPKTLFDPAKSIKGTKLWETHPEYEEDVKYIERELSEYLYKY